MTLTSSLELEATAGALLATGAVTTNGNDLKGTASGNLTFQSAIDATGTSGGNVTFASTGGNVTVNSIDTSATVGSAGSIVLQPASSYTTDGSKQYPNGLIVFDGSGTVILQAKSVASKPDGAISLAPLGRGVPQSIATMVSSTVGNDVVFNGGSFTMGTNEAMTVFGNIVIAATSYTALSDLVSLDMIILPNFNDCPIATSNYCPSNFLVSRPPAPLILDTGVIDYSPNVHIIAKTAVDYSGGTITPNCSSTPPVLRNITTEPTLTAAKLQYAGRILNFDTESQPAPTPAPTPSGGGGSCPNPSPLPRADYISILIRAGAELQDLLPPFWHGVHIERIPKICPENKEERCKELFLRFQTFSFANDVR